jgi:phage tail P2-like protein
MSREKLLPPNHTQEEAALVKVSERLLDLPAYAPRWVAYPEEAPDDVLPFLAIALDVPGEVWKLATDRNEKIQILRNAIKWHRIEGTRGLIEQLLAALNIRSEISEWFEYDGVPFCFRLDIYLKKLLENNVVFSPEVQRQILAVINAYKNARSHLDELRLGCEFSHGVGVTGQQTVSAYRQDELVSPKRKTIKHPVRTIALTSHLRETACMQETCSTPAKKSLKHQDAVLASVGTQTTLSVVEQEFALSARPIRSGADIGYTGAIINMEICSSLFETSSRAITGEGDIGFSGGFSAWALITTGG